VRAGDDALGLLAEAVKQHPDNEELASEAFLQLVRANDRKGAQQVRPLSLSLSRPPPLPLRP